MILITNKNAAEIRKKMMRKAYGAGKRTVFG